MEQRTIYQILCEGLPGEFKQTLRNGSVDLNIPEIADALGCSPPLIYSWIKNNTIAAHWIYKLTEIRGIKPDVLNFEAFRPHIYLYKTK